MRLAYFFFLVVYQLVSVLSLFLANHIVLRERECILEGTRVKWTDRVFWDGTIFLSLDRTDNWTPHVPQALGLKGLLEQAEQQATNNIRLEEGCARLMRELKLSEEHSGMPVYIDTYRHLKRVTVNPAQKIFLQLFIMLSVLLTCTFRAFFFSFQTTVTSISDSPVHICDINWTNLAQLPAL